MIAGSETSAAESRTCAGSVSYCPRAGREEVQGARAEPYCFVHPPQSLEVNPISEAEIVTIGVVAPKSFAMMSLDCPEKPASLSQ